MTATPDENTKADEVFRLNTEGLTWVALLGHWTAFARTALKLPKDAQSQLIKETVPDLIGLQAVWFALGGLEALGRDEQLLGVNRAGVLIDRHAQNIQERWQGQAVPGGIIDMIQDAQAALDRETRRLIGENPTESGVDAAFGK